MNRNRPSANSAGPSVLLTCEHATARVPAGLSIPLSVTQSHRGWDLGAAFVARRLQQKFAWPMYLGSVSRLVIDLNRSLSHPHVFSKWSAGLSDLKRARLIDQYYQPYRDAIEQHIRTQRAAQTVVHLSIHSFTPVLQRQRREVEVGLLFDPARSGERKLAHQLHLDLQRVAPAQGLWRVRANRPYRGTSDGLTTYLRTCFSAHHYVGIEIELNQKLLKERLGDTARRVCLALAALA